MTLRIQPNATSPQNPKTLKRSEFYPMAPILLRPDSKGRIGVSALVRVLEERYVGYQISGFVAELQMNDTIVLRPRVELDPSEIPTIALAKQDWDAFTQAVEKPAEPSDTLKAAYQGYKERKMRA